MVAAAVLVTVTAMGGGDGDGGGGTGVQWWRGGSKCIFFVEMSSASVKALLGSNMHNGWMYKGHASIRG